MLRQSVHRVSCRYGTIREARSRLHTGVRPRARTEQANRALPTLSKFALFGAAAVTLWYNYHGFVRPVMNDAEAENKRSKSIRTIEKELLDDGHLNTIAWGSNR